MPWREGSVWNIPYSLDLGVLSQWFNLKPLLVCSHWQVLVVVRQLLQRNFQASLPWLNSHPVLFTSTAWRSFASIQKVIWAQEAAPECWCKSEVWKCYSYKRLYLWTFCVFSFYPSVLNSFPSLGCFRQDTWIPWLFPAPWLSCPPWWWERWWLRGAKVHGQKWEFLLSLKLEVKMFSWNCCLPAKRLIWQSHSVTNSSQRGVIVFCWTSPGSFNHLAAGLVLIPSALRVWLFLHLRGKFPEISC